MKRAGYRVDNIDRKKLGRKSYTPLSKMCALVGNSQASELVN